MPKDPRRAHARHGTDTISCPLGEVRDISATGMRVFAKRGKLVTPGQTIAIQLKAPNASLSLKARVVWVNGSWHFGLLGREIGFTFDGLTREQVKVLGVVAQFGFLPRTKAARQSFADTMRAAEQGDAGPPDGQSPGGARPQSQASAGDGWSWGSGGARVDVSVVLSDYYQTLGLPHGADRHAIKAAYRELAKSCHPDVAEGADRHQRFVEINRAYHMLMQNVA